MHRYRAWLFVLLLAQLLACAPTSLVGTHPQIQVTPLILNFGTVSGSFPVTLQVTIADTGNATLQLQSVAITQNTSRLFTAGVVPSTVGAGGTTAVNVLMEAEGAPPGDYAATLVINTNASNAPQIVVQLEGTVGSGQSDAGPSDAGSSDAGSSDAGSSDAGPSDAGPADAGGLVDAGAGDAGTNDAGAVDDAGPADAGAGDAGFIELFNDAGCPVGQVMCNDRCTDTRSDPYNCGTCGTYCNQFTTPSDAGVGCSGGFCVACSPTSGYTTLADHQEQPVDLALYGGNLYWAAQNAAAIARVSVDGGVPVTIVDSADFGSTQFQPTNLAIDSSDIFFANDESQTVWQIGLNGGTATNLEGYGAFPQKVAIDSEHRVYWVTYTTGEVWQARGDASDGGTATPLVPAPSSGPPGEIYDLMGVDSTYVYWLEEGVANNNSGAIMRVAFDGSSASTILSGLPFSTGGTVDSTSVYWVEYAGNIVKAASNGGTPVTFVTGLAGPRHLVVDGNDAYWSAGGTDGTLMTCNSTVQSVSLNGGPITDYATGQYSSYAIAVDQSSVYWTDLYYGTVMKTPK